MRKTCQEAGNSKLQNLTEETPLLPSGRSGLWSPDLGQTWGRSQIPPASRPCADESGPEIHAQGLGGGPRVGIRHLSQQHLDVAGGQRPLPWWDPWTLRVDPPSARVVAQTSRKNGCLLPPRAFHLGNVVMLADSPARARPGQADQSRRPVVPSLAAWGCWCDRKVSLQERSSGTLPYVEGPLTSSWRRWGSVGAWWGWTCTHTCSHTLSSHTPTTGTCTRLPHVFTHSRSQSHRHFFTLTHKSHPPALLHGPSCLRN